VAVILLYLIIGSFWFQPWYFLWLFAPAALLPESRWVRNVTPWLALGGLWSSAAASYLPPLTRTMLDRTGRVAVTVMLTWLPGLLAAIVNRQSRVAQNQL
jgi:formate hydrogenlyase subunit 4